MGEHAADPRGIWSGKFWKDAAERAVWTFAQAGAAFLTVGVGFGDVDWLRAGSVAGVAAVGSLLKSVLATRVGDPNSASVAR